jgi:uncharacterized protein YbjT (DUF2867 family)
MILVTGATGSIGRSLVRRLQHDRVPVLALARDEAKGRELDCDFVLGDLDQPDSIAAAMRNADRLFLNSAGAQPVPGEQPMIRQQKAAIDAARAAGVQKVVKVSATATPSAPRSRRWAKARSRKIPGRAPGRGQNRAAVRTGQWCGGQGPGATEPAGGQR